MVNNPVLSRIPDHKPVRIYLPIKNNNQRYRTQAVYITLSPPLFELRFEPGTLPVEHLDTEKACLVNVDFGGPNISLKAMISSSSKQILKMNAEELISHDQMREFFRVDAVTDVISKSFRPEFFDQLGHPWSICGKTIDISGNGILASFCESPPDEHPVRLEISLPGETSHIAKVLADPVRSTRIDADQWEVAYHFQKISSDDRDRIIGCCLEIQRRLLRLKVEVDA